MNPIENFVEANQEDILPIDQGDLEDIQACAPYIKEIYLYLLQNEQQYQLAPTFLSKQQGFSSDDRAVLFDWLSRAHSKFNLANESYFHCMTIFDKVLEKIKIFPYDAKIIGIACLLIAAKYEQSYIPSLRHFVEIVAQEPGVRYVNCEQCCFQMQKSGVQNYRSFAFLGFAESNYDPQPETSVASLEAMQKLPQCNECARAALVEAEEEILHIMDFILNQPSPLVFLRRYAKIANMKARDRYIAFYLGELCMLNDQVVIKYHSSLLAAGCIAMTRRLTRKPSWSDELQQYSGYSEADVREILADVSFTLRSLALSPKAKYIRRKYAQQDRFYGVSVLIEQVVSQIIGQ